MADEPTEPIEPKEPTEPTEPAKEPTTATEPAAPVEPTEPEPGDKHGNPGVNREKYQRDLKTRDDKIADLEKQLDEASKTEKGRADLKKQLDDLKAESADKEVGYQLQLAGCVNEKAAKALLGDYEGIDKLKEACPYLFGSAKQEGSTGVKPQGAGKTGTDKKIDDIFSQK